MKHLVIKGATAFVVVSALCSGTASAEGMAEAAQALPNVDYGISDEAQDFETGRPSRPSDSWMIAAGGRVYDSWWDARDRPEPTYFSHPAYPAEGRQSGADTWRCKECHGWDYKGVDGVYRSGSHFTGIKGIEAWKGRDETEIVALLRAPLHGYTPEMIDDDGMQRIAAFVSRGQFDVSPYIDLASNQLIAGDASRGREVFQTVCAACHGFDGRELDFSTDHYHAYLGTEANDNPVEIFHKIMNGHPGEEMINLRAFGPDLAVDVLRYASTLPVD